MSCTEIYEKIDTTVMSLCRVFSGQGSNKLRSAGNLVPLGNRRERAQRCHTNKKKTGGHEEIITAHRFQTTDCYF